MLNWEKKKKMPAAKSLSFRSNVSDADVFLVGHLIDWLIDWLGNTGVSSVVALNSAEQRCPERCLQPVNISFFSMSLW